MTLTLDQLSNEVKAWTDTLGQPWAPRMRTSLCRSSTPQHADQMMGFMDSRLLQVPNLARHAQHQTYLTRLSGQLGPRDYLAATPQDIEAVINAPEYRKYHQGTTDFSVRTIKNNAYLQEHQLASFTLFFQYLYMEQGKEAHEARKDAKTFLAKANIQWLGPAPMLKQYKVTPEQVADLQRALPATPVGAKAFIQLTLWFNLLIVHGDRATGLLRSTIGCIQWSDGKAVIAVPAGYNNKHTKPVFCDAALTAMLKAWLAHHPDVKNAKAPLFYDAALLDKGIIKALDPTGLARLITKLGRASNFPGRLGVRCFRKFVATEAVVQGASDATLQSKLSHSGGRSTHRYPVIGPSEVAQSARATRSGRRPGRYSTCCGYKFRAGDIACGSCGRATDIAGDDIDPAQARRDLAGQFGLDCIDDLEAAHAS
ncbi:MAG: hypothetical protein WC876_07575 [Candidatus Thermoplasmatota archaeon]|jgi:integrase